MSTRGTYASPETPTRGLTHATQHIYNLSVIKAASGVVKSTAKSAIYSVNASFEPRLMEFFELSLQKKYR